jgi:hypothetical protein
LKEDTKKQKLTLAIDKSVIEKAKSEGINISNLTEEILTAVTSNISEYDQNNLVKMYESYFNTLKPYLEKYGIEIEVGNTFGKFGEIRTPVPINLDHSGLSYAKYPNDDLTTSMFAASLFTKSKVTIITPNVVDVLNKLHDPTKILQIFLEKIIDASKKNKEKIQQFKFALGMVKALSEGDETSIEK